MVEGKGFVGPCPLTLRYFESTTRQNAAERGIVRNPAQPKSEYRGGGSDPDSSSRTRAYSLRKLRRDFERTLSPALATTQLTTVRAAAPVSA